MKKTKRSVFKTQKKRSLLSRVIRKFFAFTLTLVILVGFAIYYVLSSSLPQYDGSVDVEDISQSVTIERDALGTAKIQAENRHDLAFSLGWLHAQERYFQMDLLRRRAAGELSEIIGPATLSADKKVRVHRFRHRAEQILNYLSNEHRALIDAYTLGVNKGLNALDTSPFEYWLLQTEPQAWQASDTLLVVYAMYLTLQDSGVERERVLTSAFNNLDETTFNFLLPKGSVFDAPILSNNFILNNSPNSVMQQTSRTSLPIQNTVKHSKISDQQQTNINQQSTQSKTNSNDNDPDAKPGSNNFAISGSRSQYRSAIIAGDMHLSHGVPNIWFKANLSYKHKQQDIHLSGVTLPGTPLLISGTNNQIAWAFTNSYGDYSDVISVTTSPDKPGQYKHNNNWHNFHYANEVIKIKGQASQTLKVKETIFGPVLQETNDKAHSFLWVAHDSKAVNLNLINFEQATSVEQALKLAKNVSIPAQNLLVGDTKGNIGWTIIGPLPQRNNQSNPYTTIHHVDGKIQWLDAEHYPYVINPDNNALWTANSRVVDGDDLKKVGDGGYALGVRAKLIRDKLIKLDNANERDLLAIQLDTDAELYWRWRDHLLSELQKQPFKSNQHQEAIDLIKHWNGKSDSDQAGFTLIRAYRNNVKKQLLSPLTKQLDKNAKYSFSYYSSQYEQTLWTLVTEQPSQYLPSNVKDYQSVFNVAFDKVVERYTSNHQQLSDQVWGMHNQLNIKHPISQAVPFLGVFLDRQHYAMPGDTHSPRVQTPRFGASQRMVIAPGQPESAIFHMPGGQSGHPLSPFYNTGFDDWVIGEATPLTSTNPIHTLTLKAKSK